MIETHADRDQQEERLEREGYSPGEAAKVIGVGRTTVHALINQKRLRVVKVGARTIIPRGEIDRLLRVDADENR